MRKTGSIFILIWALFRFIFHTFDFDSEIATFLYFGGNDFAVCGFLLILYTIKIRFTFLTKRMLKILLIYSIWCLIVDMLIMIGTGAHDTALYTSIDIGILSIGGLWAIYV